MLCITSFLLPVFELGLQIILYIVIDFLKTFLGLKLSTQGTFNRV